MSKYPAATADPAIYPLTLYYDASCPMCNGEMQNLMLRNTDDLLRFVDASAPSFSAFPPGTDRAALMALMHAQRADGQVVHGIEALRLAYQAAGLGWVARVMDAPLIRPLGDWLYPIVARNRYRVPRPISRLFETTLRRAAERRGGASPCRDGACDLPDRPKD